jgi:hypothetical protein
LRFAEHICLPPRLDRLQRTLPYGAMIKTGLIVSAIVLVLIAIFGPAIRRGYLSVAAQKAAIEPGAYAVLAIG